jgi:glycosyltransferase involved in cell wall biosynthesis
MRRLKILTWHTHGAYLYYLTQVPHDFYVLSKPGRPPGYGGRAGDIPWGDNVHDLPVRELNRQALDCVLFQDDVQYMREQHELLTEGQRSLPKIYLEHDPPRAHPTDTLHPVQDPNALLVHVTPFNALMWDNGVTPVRVVEHGVTQSAVRWTGELERGLTIVNHMASRGRRLGWDLFQDACRHVPLELIGMGEEAREEVPHPLLPRFAARYRFLFHPVRYTSLALAAIEAMMLGMPVVALATTEMSTVLRTGENGIVDTDPAALLDGMRALLADPVYARSLGEKARATARARFGIDRFVADWIRVLAEATQTRPPGRRPEGRAVAA